MRIYQWINTTMIVDLSFVIMKGSKYTWIDIDNDIRYDEDTWNNFEDRNEVILNQFRFTTQGE